MKAKYARLCAVGTFAIFIALGGLVGANRASAQTKCSYPFDNCPTTTTSNRPEPVIILDLKSATPGATVHIIVCGYAPGTVVKITINSEVVQTIVVGTEPPESCKGKGGVAMRARGGGGGIVAVVGPLGRLVNARVTAQAQTLSGAQGQFTVPANLRQGSYLVCAEAPNVPDACTNFDVARALGADLSSGNSSSNASLAFTGGGLVRLLAIGLALLAVGWMLVVGDESLSDAG